MVKCISCCDEFRSHHCNLKPVTPLKTNMLEFHLLHLLNKLKWNEHSASLISCLWQHCHYGSCLCYSPPTKLREGNVLHLSVILFTGSVWCHFLSHCLVPSSFWGVYDVTSSLTAWSHVPLLGGSAFEGGLPLRGVYLWEGSVFERGLPTRGHGTPRYWHLVTVTKVGGARPTGMHSCLKKMFLLNLRNIKLIS